MLLFGTWRVRRRLRKGADQAAALGPKAVGALIGALEARDVHRAASEALVCLGAVSRPALLRALGRKRPPVRRILEVLGRLRPRSDPGPLLPYLEASDRRIRLAAARAVSRQGGPRAHKALAPLLTETDGPIRDVARRHFARSTDPRAVRPLALAVAHGDEPGSRFAAGRIRALGPLAVGPLLDALRTHDEPLRDTIGYLLDGLNDADSLVILCKGLEEDDPRIWGTVRDALARKSAISAPYVLPLVRHPDARVRGLADELLAGWSPADGPPVLATVL